MKESIILLFPSGAIGYRYGFPNDFILVVIIRNKNIEKTIPTIPRRDANIKKISFHSLMAFTIETWENIKLHIDDIAITMTMIGDTIPADTAASPRTMAPRMLMAFPDTWGILRSLSLRISKIRIIPIASIKVGKGTPFRCWAKFTIRVRGIVSWLKVVIAM